MILIIKNELKKAFKLRYIIAFILIALILQGFLQVGKLIHLENVKNKNSLQASERSRVIIYTMFRQYASLGITLFFVPSTFGILYNDSTYELLVSNSNIGDTFNIYLPKNAKQLFSINSPFMTFMGISLLLIFFFGILYGIPTTNNKDYLIHLSSQSGTKKVLRFIIFFRLILLNAAFLLMFVMNISVLLINKINLFRLPLLTFWWGLFLVISLSFVIGCILGTIQSNIKRNIAFFVIYLLSVILLMLLLNVITKLNAGDIKPVFEFNHDNLIEVMGEEQDLKKKHGVLPINRNPTKEEIIDARQSIFNQSEKILANLDRLKKKLESKIKTRNLIASFFPTLFYFSLCEDASTNGYDSFIEFFTFSKDRKEKFVQFSVDRIYPLPKDEPVNQSKKDSKESKESKGNKGDKGVQTNPPKVESFIKDDEDLFFAKSKLPRNFWLGSIISILWIASGLFITYKRSFKQIKGEPGAIRNFDVDMKSGKFNYLLTADQGLKNQVQNTFTGDGPSFVNLRENGELINPKDFIYVYETKKFVKDIYQNCLYKDLFGKEMPSDLKPWQFLIDYAVESKKFLLLDNFFKGMDINKIDTFIENVKRSGIKALYIGDDYYQAINLDDHLIFCDDDLSIPDIAERVKLFKNKKGR